MIFRIHYKPQSKYLYALSAQESKLIRVIGILSLISLVPLSIGFVLFLHISILATILFLPFFLVVLIYHFINSTLLATYSGFNSQAHQKLVKQFAQTGNKTKVAVMIPAAGEAYDVVLRTVTAAMKLNYKNKEVFLLDDSKKGIYRGMDTSTGVTYFRRRNVGQNKKAGNLNSLVKSLKGFTNILVLDADFVARREMIDELMPYSGDDVGIVQSPQHFDINDSVYRRSKIEFGAALIQRDFYRVTQVARNRFGSAICVGTNALYNVKALKQVGGFEGVGRAEWGHSEDVNTGLKLINTHNKAGARYVIKYVPIQLAIGTCPDTHESFYKQQNRWCTGSMQLLFSRKTLFSRNLSIAQKLCYLSNSAYYFYTIALLFTPIQLLILLLSKSQYQWKYTYFFIPMIVVNYILIPFVMRRRSEILAVSIVVLSNAYTFTQALYLLARRRPLGWEATGSKSAERNKHFTQFKVISSSFFILVYLATICVLIINNRIGINASSFIVGLFLVSFIAHIAFLNYTLLSQVKPRTVHLDRKAYAAFAILIATAAVLFSSLHYRNKVMITASSSTVIAIAPERKASPVPQPVVAKAPVVIATLTPSYTIKVNDNLSLASSELATTIIHSKDRLPNNGATEAKLQDAIMRHFGYQQIILPGSTYSLTAAEVTELVNQSYVSSDELLFWTEYGSAIQS